jgi:hypothetical protein
MANNFKFLSNRTRDKISLKLYGDFDGSADLLIKLLDTLSTYFRGAN